MPERRRLHAGATRTRCAPQAASNVNPRCTDRRLCARRREKESRGRSGSASPIAWSAPALCDLGRHPPHGRALGLCAAQLFAAHAQRDRCRADFDLSGSTVMALFASGWAQIIGIAAWARWRSRSSRSCVLRLSRPCGHSAPAITFVHALHIGFRVPICRRQGRRLERARTGEGS